MQQPGTLPILVEKNRPKGLRDPSLFRASVLACLDHVMTLCTNILKILFGISQVPEFSTTYTPS